MRDIRWRQVRESPEGYQERLLGTLDEMIAVERVANDGEPSAIWTSYDYWRSRARRGNLPHAPEFDLGQTEIAPGNPVRRMSMVDVTASDPMGYIFHKHPGNFHIPNSPYPRHEGLPIGRHPLKQNRHALAEEYQLCISARRPLYHEITQIFYGYRRIYRRVLLPATDRAGKVVSIFTAIRLMVPQGAPSFRSA